MWHLPGIRTKTGQPLDIPLPTMAVAWLQKLNELACNAEHVLPERKLQSRMVPHVAQRCLNHKLKGVEGVYNRHDYFEERRRALDAWGQLLLKLGRGDATAKTGKVKAA